MSEILISADKVSKKFCRDLRTSLRYGICDLLAVYTGMSNRTGQVLRDKEFWAVKDVSFEVRRGECLGLIGHNGSGKSTLLKMLNGLLRPDTGRIEMRGRVGALIELGAGFNPVLTGRENIFNNGALLGMSRLNVRNKMEEIVEFSELGEFIDSPVSFYSSGMRMRLGFSIAVHSDPDILLLDEVLAVGDLGFTLKCYNKMDELQQKTAMVFVSHSMPKIARMCTGIVVMNAGCSINPSFDVSAGISKYYDAQHFAPGQRFDSGVAELVGIALRSGEHVSQPGEIFELCEGESLDILLTLKLHRPVQNPKLWLVFLDREQRGFAEIGNFDKFHTGPLSPGPFSCSVVLGKLSLNPGLYSITLGLHEEAVSGRNQLLRIQSAVYFKVNGKKQGWVPIQIDTRWQFS